MRVSIEGPTFQSNKESEPIEIGSLVPFDEQYFKILEGETGWNALEGDFYSNQRYFTVLDLDQKKLGIVGVYDTPKEKNVTHTVVDPTFRGQGLANKFKDRLMEELALDYITLTIDLNNEASIRAAQKLPGIERVSDAEYEQEYHKVKFVYHRPE